MKNKSKKPLVIGILLVVVLIGIIAISSSEEPKQEAGDDNKITYECMTVPTETISWIESGLVSDTVLLENAQAVRSSDFQEVYFVSVYTQEGNASDGRIATFAVNNLNGSGLVLSVNELAKEITDWFHGDREGAQYYVTMSNDGASKSQDCLSTD